jgi:type IV secretion system protein VirB9
MSGRNRHRFVAVLFLGTCTLGNSARAQVIQEYDYVPDRIYQVHTGLGITTQIELSPSERVIDYSTGFTSGWDLVRRDNVFYLKPKDVDADTNLMIRTEMHSYIFELRVVATDWKVLDQAKQAGVQYKITFKYPNDTEFKSPAQSVPQLGNTLDGNRHYNFDYDYSTRTRLRWLVPTVVYDDGQFTYIKMTDMTVFPTGDFPAVFAREREGSEDFVVNTTVENNMIVVHGTYPYLVIRHGKNTVGLRRNHSK